jgi:hypothetical protein
VKKIELWIRRKKHQYQVCDTSGNFLQRTKASDRLSFLEKRADNNRRLRGIGEVQKEETK